MIEVELKFEVPPESRAPLQAKLAALPGILDLGQVVNVDRYVDTPLLTCLQRAVFIRIRNDLQLDLKFHDRVDPGHTHSTERTFPLHASFCMNEINTLCARFIPGWRAAATVEEAICVNGLVVIADITNRRRYFAYDSVTFCLDEIEELGCFFEIETLCEGETEIEPSLARLHAFVSSLAIPALRPLQTGYVEQWLERSHPRVADLNEGVCMTRSDVASFRKQQAEVEQAARLGLSGLAISARHEMITARMQQGADRILGLIQARRHKEAQDLMNTAAWGVGDQEAGGSGTNEREEGARP